MDDTPPLTGEEWNRFREQVQDDIVRMRRQINNSTMLILRLARRLPENDDVRVKALDYLHRERLMPSVLRNSREAAKE